MNERAEDQREQGESAVVEAMRKKVDAFVNGETTLPTNSEIEFMDDYPEVFKRYTDILPLYEETTTNKYKNHSVTSRLLPNTNADHELWLDSHIPFKAFQGVFAELGVDPKDLVIQTKWRASDPQFRQGITYVKEVGTNREGVVVRVIQRPDSWFDKEFELVRGKVNSPDYPIADSPIFYAGREEALFDQYRIGGNNIKLLKDDVTAPVAEDDKRVGGVLAERKYKPEWIEGVIGEEEKMLIAACQEVVNKEITPQFSFNDFLQFVQHMGKLVGRLETVTPNQTKFQTSLEFGDSKANLYLQAEMRDSAARTECSIEADNAYRDSATSELISWVSDELSPEITIGVGEGRMRTKKGKLVTKSYWLGKDKILGEVGNTEQIYFHLPLTNEEVRKACQQFLTVYKKGYEEAERKASQPAVPEYREVAIPAVEGEERLRLEEEGLRLVKEGSPENETYNRVAAILVLLMGGVENYSQEVPDLKLGETAVAPLDSQRFLQVRTSSPNYYPTTDIFITDTALRPTTVMRDNNGNPIYAGTYFEFLHVKPGQDPSQKDQLLSFDIDLASHLEGIESVFLGEHIAESEFSATKQHFLEAFPSNKTHEISRRISLAEVREPLTNIFEAYLHSQTEALQNTNETVD